MSDIITLAKMQTGVVFETLSQSSHMIVWAGTNGRILMANRSFIKTCGYRNLDHAVGSHYSEQPSEGGEFHETWEQQDQLTFASDSPVTLVSYLKPSRSDERLLIYGIKHPAFNADGECIGTVSHFYDMHQSPELRWVPLLCRQDLASGASNAGGAFAYTIAKAFECKKRKVRLTKRQSECLFLAVRGLTAQEISEILSLSRRTVEDYLDQVKAELNTESRSEMISAAIELGFMNLIPQAHFNRLMGIARHLAR